MFAALVSLVVAALAPNAIGTWTAAVLAIAFAVMAKPPSTVEVETHESDDVEEVEDNPIKVVGVTVNRDVKAIPKNDGSGDIERLAVTPDSTFWSVILRKNRIDYTMKVSEEDAHVVQALLAGAEMPPPPAPGSPVEPTA